MYPVNFPLSEGLSQTVPSISVLCMSLSGCWSHVTDYLISPSCPRSATFSLPGKRLPFCCDFAPSFIFWFCIECPSRLHFILFAATNASLTLVWSPIQAFVLWPLLVYPSIIRSTLLWPVCYFLSISLLKYQDSFHTSWMARHTGWTVSFLDSLVII